MSPDTEMRPATDDEATRYFAGHINIYGAEETDHGLMVPTDTDLVLVTDLREGDMVDLEGDPYADDGEDPGLEFQYAVVYAVVRETSDCVRVDFHDNDSVGFPVDHRLIRAGSVLTND